MKKAAKATIGAALTMGAAAGAYYLYGSKNAAKHRKTVGLWADKAEREIVANAKKMKDAALTDANMKMVIAQVAKRYEAAKDIDPSDVRAFIATAQKSWKEATAALKKQSGGMKKKAGSAVKKATKGAKKVIKKHL